MATFNIEKDVKYTRTHEWVRDLGDNTFRVGVSDYAAKNIGDVTYVELPEVGDEIEKGDTPCVVETVKSSEDVYSQLTGEVIANNADVLDDAPETVNSDCYGEGWLYTVKTENDEEFNELMSASEYEEYVGTLD